MSQEDESKYFTAGKVIEAKLKATKNMIAQELGANLENVAFIPQTKFHLDMELLVLPDGRVILHDEAMMRGFLEPLRQKTSAEDASLELMDGYIKTSETEEKRNAPLRERCIEIVQAHGIDCERMPLVFKSSKFASNLNYANGIFMSKGENVLVELADQTCFGRTKEKECVYVSTGPTTPLERHIHNYFANVFNDKYPLYQLVGIDNMSEFVHKYKGGVRCLSMNVSPFEG